MYEYDFSGIVNDYNGFTTSEVALTFTFSALGDKRSAARDERIRRTGAAGDRERKCILRCGKTVTVI